MKSLADATVTLRRIILIVETASSIAGWSAKLMNAKTRHCDTMLLALPTTFPPTRFTSF